MANAFTEYDQLEFGGVVWRVYGKLHFNKYAKRPDGDYLISGHIELLAAQRASRFSRSSEFNVVVENGVDSMDSKIVPIKKGLRLIHSR